MSDSKQDPAATAENTAQTKPLNGNGDTAAQTAPSEKPENTENIEKTVEEQLAESKAEAAKNLDGWQRATAEFINYRKRVDKERIETYANAAVDTFQKILPIIDDFDRAIAFIPADRQDDKALEGFRQIHRKFLNMLEATGVKRIDPAGQTFDPAFHEAIGQDEDTGKPANTVTVVLQKGYLYGDKVLRAALVRVAK
jgi:molecular chaperone GrpE